MPCYGPLTGYFSKEVNPSGRRSIVFDKRQSFSGVPIMIPCGECVGCRMIWRRQWAVRCMHEKRMHDLSTFVTLTYSDDQLPPLGSLRLRDLQLFMKRLRLARPVGLRFFGCGEYGGASRRPHYHLLLFNTDFPDMRYLKQSETDEALYRSSELSSLWSLGDHYLGAVDYRSCAYVAGYVLKKVGVPDDPGPGREREFRVMSRRPGIGFAWFEKYLEEAYLHDSAIMDGREVRLPRFYDAKKEELDADFMKRLKRKRKREALSHPEERTKQRMFVREQFEIRKQEVFKRGG